MVYIYIYIDTYIWLIFIVNVGEYSSPMDPMGRVGANLVGNCIRGLVHSEKSMLVPIPCRFEPGKKKTLTFQLYTPG